MVRTAGSEGEMMNVIHIKLNQTDDIAVIRPRGTLSVKERPVLSDLVETVDMQRSNVIVDLSDVKIVDSSGLGDLVGSHNKVSDRGGHLVLACTPHRLLTTLEVSNLDQLLENYESVAEAIAGLQKRITSAGVTPT